MGSIPRNLEFWFDHFYKQDPDQKIRTIEKLIHLKYPKTNEILIETIETEQNEEVRIYAIQNLKKVKDLDLNETYSTLKSLLIGESAEIRKSVLRTIVDLADISAIKYLTKYYYSEHSKGIKKEVNAAINDLLKIADEQNQNIKNIAENETRSQAEYAQKVRSPKNERDYKKYIKKFFK